MTFLSKWLRRARQVWREVRELYCTCIAACMVVGCLWLLLWKWED
jgi:hypothetical protein